jgi:hypothetical protein
MDEERLMERCVWTPKRVEAFDGIPMKQVHVFPHIRAAQHFTWHTILRPHMPGRSPHA